MGATFLPASRLCFGVSATLRRSGTCFYAVEELNLTMVYASLVSSLLSEMTPVVPINFTQNLNQTKPNPKPIHLCRIIINKFDVTGLYLMLLLSTNML